MKMVSEKRVALLNSVSDKIVRNMNRCHYHDTSMKVNGVSFISQESTVPGETDYLACFNFGHSPAGEDLSEEIMFFNGTLMDLEHSLRDFAVDFDVDEHVSMWLENKDHVRGVPSVRVLVQDAEEMEKFFHSLGQSFQVACSCLPYNVRKTLDTLPKDVALQSKAER